MSSFLNIDLGGATPKKFVWKHILFSILWILAILVLIFRIDVYAINSINPDYHWIVGFLPIGLLLLILVTLFSQKWYYSLAAIFYPILLIFWFFPKNILDKGKIYLFSHYVNYIFTRLANFKRTIIHYSLFIVMIMLLLLTDNQIVRAIAMITMSYFYFRFVYSYLKSSFKPAQMFGSSIEASLVEYIEDGESSSMKFIESITKEIKEDEKIPEEERKKKKLRTLIMWNFGLNYISKNLNGFKGKKAYVLSWGLQLLYFLLISIIFFTFLNYQLFHINPSNYLVEGTPNLFEFFYYTFKTIPFDGIDSIKPNSELAKIIEIVSFSVIGVFILVIVASVIFSLRQDKIKENVELATQICNKQNQYIIKHVEDEFGVTIQSALKEFADIKKSVDNLKKIIDKLF